jgi:ribonuclease/clavin/mitogillin
MITREAHGDVTRFLLTWPRSRAVGYSVSVYLTRGLLVDVGFPGVARDVDRLVDEHRPAGAIITHFHEDHAGNAELLAARGVPIVASSETLRLLRELPPVPAYRRLVWGTPRPLSSNASPFESAGLALLHLPGHSADHHVVWDAEHRTLFSGDLFLGVKVRVAHPHENPRVLAASARAAAALEPLRMFDAHRGLVANPTSALQAKARWLEDIIGRIDEKIAAGWSDRAIARELLGREEYTHYVSRGEMSRINLVRAVRHTPS